MSSDSTSSSTEPTFTSSTAHPLYSAIVASIQKVYDPELPLNVYDLGLIYQITIDEQNQVEIIMTLTNPACPVAGTLPKEIEEASSQVQGVVSTNVKLTWSPPWSKDRLSPEHQCRN